MRIDVNENELRRLDLNLLLVFSAVMRTGSAKAAADKLYLGPSAVSMALARLREHLGVPLFVRSRSGLLPTRTAEILYSKLGPALAAIGAAMAVDISFDPATTNETFRVGMTDDFEWWLLPALQSRIHEIAPGATIVVRTVDYPSARGALDDGLVDVIFTAQPARHAASLPSSRFFSEDFVVLALANGGFSDRLGIEDYLGMPSSRPEACPGESSMRSWSVSDTVAMWLSPSNIF